MKSKWRLIWRMETTTGDRSSSFLTQHTSQIFCREVLKHHYDFQACFMNDGVLKFSTWKTKKMLVVCSVIQIHRQSGLCNWGSRFVSQKGGNFKIIFSIPYLIIYKPELRETQGMWSPPHANIFHWHHLSLKTCVCSKFVKLVARLTNSYHSVQKNANANITNVFPTFINFKEILCLLGMLNSSDIRILAFPSMRIIKKIVMEKMCHWLDMVFQRYFLTKAAYVLSKSKAITHSNSCLGQDHFTLSYTNTIH